jgi:hypothetical protein
MKKNARRHRHRPQRAFLLPEIIAMRPYVASLMRGLQAVRQQRIAALALARQPIADESYVERRRRHDAIADLAGLEKEEQAVRQEFAQLGIVVGAVRHGEMLFPCLVDDQRAFFIWREGEPRPMAWRFRGERDLRPIPEHWHDLFHELVRRPARESS